MIVEHTSEKTGIRYAVATGIVQKVQTTKTMIRDGEEIPFVQFTVSVENYISEKGILLSENIDCIVFARKQQLPAIYIGNLLILFGKIVRTKRFAEGKRIFYVNMMLNERYIDLTDNAMNFSMGQRRMRRSRNSRRSITKAPITGSRKRASKIKIKDFDEDGETKKEIDKNRKEGNTEDYDF